MRTRERVPAVVTGTTAQAVAVRIETTFAGTRIWAAFTTDVGDFANAAGGR
jgi:hypothetical protein